MPGFELSKECFDRCVGAAGDNWGFLQILLCHLMRSLKQCSIHAYPRLSFRHFGFFLLVNSRVTVATCHSSFEGFDACRDFLSCAIRLAIAFLSCTQLTNCLVRTPGRAARAKSATAGICPSLCIPTTAMPAVSSRTPGRMHIHPGSSLEAANSMKMAYWVGRTHMHR